MQQAVLLLRDLGTLPASGIATASILERFERELLQVKAPITDEEAYVLAKRFGPDDCFGLAWTLVHLIESAPGWPLKQALDEMTGEWAARLKARSSPA